MTFPAGSILAGWGKGKFRDGSEQKCKDNELEFTCGAETYGMMDNKLNLLTDLLTAEQKVKSQHPKLCYHTIKQDPSGGWEFLQDTCIYIYIHIFICVTLICIFLVQMREGVSFKHLTTKGNTHIAMLKSMIVNCLFLVCVIPFVEAFPTRPRCVQSFGGHPCRTIQ